MARYGTKRGEHLVGTVKALGDRETVDDKGEKVMKPAWQVSALCNDSYAKRTTFVEPGVIDYHGFAKFAWGHNTCSQCQSIHYRKLLKEMGPKFPYYLGERYDMSAPLPHGISKWAWKSVYPVFERGLLADRDDPERIVAFICIENGWGKSWSIHGWQTSHVRISDIGSENADFTPKMCSAAADTRMYDFTYNDDYRVVDRSKPPKTYKVIAPRDGEPVEKFLMTDAKHYASKEEALLSMIPPMVEDGALKRYSACLEEATGWVAAEKKRAAERAVESAQREVEREQRQRRETEENDLIMDGLISLAERSDLGNVEREAVFLAFKRIFKKPLEEAAASARTLAGEPVAVIAPQPAPAPALEPAAADSDDDWSFS